VLFGNTEERYAEKIDEDQGREDTPTSK